MTVRCGACRKPFQARLSGENLRRLSTMSAKSEVSETLSVYCDDCVTQVGAVYSPRAGERVRIAIRYDGSWRSLFWVRVAVAGDIYCGHGYENAMENLATFSRTQSGSQVRISYADEGERVAGPWKNGRISFHVSGQINVGDMKAAGTPLAAYAADDLLGFMLFEHPSAFPMIKSLVTATSAFPSRTRRSTVSLAPSTSPPRGSQCGFHRWSPAATLRNGTASSNTRMSRVHRAPCRSSSATGVLCQRLGGPREAIS
jgi:hypothetical protein